MAELLNVGFQASASLLDDSDVSSTPSPEDAAIDALRTQYNNLHSDFKDFKTYSLIGLGCISGVLLILILTSMFLIFWIIKLQKLVKAIDPLSRYKKVRPSTFIRPRERADAPSLGKNKHVGTYDSGVNNNTYSETYDNADSNRNINHPYETPRLAPAIPNQDRTALDNGNFSSWDQQNRHSFQPNFLNQQRPPINFRRNPAPAIPSQSNFNDMGTPFY